MVSTLIAAAAASLIEAGIFTSLTAATFAVSFALSQIVTRIFADNPESQQDMGVRQQVPPSAVNAIPIVYGDAYMGGTFVDAVLTTDQKTMYYVLAISSISQANATLGTAAGVLNYDTTKMYYGDRLITFDGSDLTKVVSLTDEAGNVDTKISGNLYINLYKSSNAGVITSANGASAPSTVMGGSDIAVGQRWPASNRQMNNLAFAIVKLVYNRDADTTQLQPITFNLSHYPNGASVAKPGDVWLDYMSNASYGGAIPPASLDTTCVATLNAYSDATITYTPAGGGSPVTQARYRINGVLDAGQTVLNNVDRIMSACDSWMTYNAALGQWSVVINKAESAAYAFTDNNIIGDIRVGATDITSSINQVEARFPFKSNRDQASFVNIQTPSGLLYPNEPVNKYSITYDLVNDSVQAQYLANRLLEQAREDLLVSFNTTYYGIQVDAGNVISVTNADYGWNAKLFRVMKVNEASLPDGSLGARLELTEYNAQIYDDYDITQFTPVPNSNLASPVYFSALSAPTVIASRPTDAVPSFDVQVAIPATGRVTFGTLFYSINPSDPLAWKVLDSASSPNNTPVTNSTNYTFANQVLPAGTLYFTYTVGNEIASSQRSANSAAFVWSPTGASGPAGTNGLTALTAYLVQSQSSATPTFTTPTSGATAPSGWSLTAPAVSVGQVMWYIQGRYNSNAVTIDGVAAGTTAWTGPVAASIFQDIRSDNWNGSNPPTYGSSGTYGTTGYYIQQSTGDAYFNRGIFRGTVESAVSGSRIILGESASEYLKVYDSLGTTVFRVAGVAGLYTNVQIAGASNTLGLGALSVTNASGYGGNAFNCTNNGTGHGITSIAYSTGSTRNAVLALGYGTSTNGAALYAANSGNYGIYCSGQFGIDNSTLVTNLNANYLQGYTASNFMLTGSTATDSNALGGVTASSWARIFVGDIGTANASGSGMNFNCLITGYQFRGTSNYMYIEPVSDRRLKENIEPEILGLDFVNALNPVTYNMIGQQRKAHGFIAQDVETLITSANDSLKIENSEGIKGVDYLSLIAPLVKAIQELTAKVKALEAQLKG